MLIEKKLLKSFIPFIGTVLMVGGYLKLSIYYNYFDIEIYNYLELSEILTLFMPDIIRNVIILFISLFFVYITIGTNQLQNNRKLIDRIIESNSFWKRLKLLIKLQGILVIWFIISLITSIVTYIWQPNRFDTTIILTIELFLIFIFFILNFEYERKYNLRNNEKLKNSHQILSYVAFLFLLFTVRSAYNEIKQVRKKYKSVEFIYKEKTIKSDEQNFYLGETKNYLFFKNFDKNEVSIYERNKISHFKTRK